jgi:hypothetical protein
MKHAVAITSELTAERRLMGANLSIALVALFVGIVTALRLG